MDTKLALIKPVISPPAYPDESAKGFLIRVAAINNYAKCSWLFDASYREQISSKTLYDLLSQASWTGFSDIDTQTREIYTVCTTSLRGGVLKYCPQCLAADGYLQASWELTLSCVCVRHRIWLRLVDSENSLLKKNPDSQRCEPTSLVSSEKAPETLLRWQAFLENKHIEDKEHFPLLLENPEHFTLKERLEIGHFYRKWVAHVSSLKTSANFRRTEKEERILSTEFATALFSGRSGYRAFIVDLLNVESQESDGKETIKFSNFYREFNDALASEKLEPIKKFNDEIINCNWRRSLCRRNRSFGQEVLSSHQWIAFEVACRKYGIHKSDLYRALKEQRIEHEKKYRKSREFIDIHEPSLQKLLFQIKDCITAKDAALILGLTKLQFSQLRESGCFKNMIPPRKGHCAEWRFSKDEVLEYLGCFTDELGPWSSSVFTLAQVFKYYGGKIDNAVVSVLGAMERGELICRGIEEPSKGIRALLLDRNDFLGWYTRHKQHHDRNTIVQAAKILGVNQELTYQLVNHNFLDYEIVDNDLTRWISANHIKAFKVKYIFLSKLSKALGIKSRALMAYLKGCAIFPVDENQTWKLRQKLYLRSALEPLAILAEALPTI